MAETSVRIFISYAHEDEVLQRKLAEHLRILDGCASPPVISPAARRGIARSAGTRFGRYYLVAA
jgi:hypothetical protein